MHDEELLWLIVNIFPYLGSDEHRRSILHSFVIVRLVFLYLRLSVAGKVRETTEKLENFESMEKSGELENFPREL